MKISFLYGADLRGLFRLFGKARFKLLFRSIPDLLLHFIMACFNTLLSLSERFRSYSEQPKKPIYILGHWRSVTTHLHNLMNVDGKFLSSNTFHAAFPHSFWAEKWLAPLLDQIGPGERLMDRMKMVMASVQEEEIALASLGAPSSYLAIHFPLDADRYRSYVSFRNANEREREEWKSAYGKFMSKFQELRGDGRSLVLKSPAHTARIPMLLDLYPEARFIHIHRNPYETIRSSLHLYDSWFKMVNFQSLDSLKRNRDQLVLDMYEEVHRCWIEDKHLIPTERLYMLSFESLKQEPLTSLQKIYGFLGEELDEAAIATYLNSITSYKQNRYDALSSELIQQINERMGFVFEEFGYEMQSHIQEKV
ncbi:MAG: sulfotransferase [Bacteroidota bacterium]